MFELFKVELFNLDMERFFCIKVEGLLRILLLILFNEMFCFKFNVFKFILLKI